MDSKEPHMDTPTIDIDGALVAGKLGLSVDEFRLLMADGKIRVLCERGTGDDTGRFRASFYHGSARARFVVDATGKLLESL